MDKITAQLCVMSLCLHMYCWTKEREFVFSTLRLCEFLHDTSSRPGYITGGNHFVYELFVIVQHKLSST